MNLEELIFSPELKREIDDTIELLEYSPKLVERGFAPVWAILLCGPPGCGKTTVAKEIAKKLDLYIIEKETSAIIDSHMGGAGKNFSGLFNDHSGKCLILNEFDALGMSRESDSDSGTGKEQIRTTSSILQCMDRERNKPALFIATTNHIDKIDKAILRRFSKVIEFESPTVEMHRNLVEKMKSKHNFENLVPDKIYKSSPSLATTKQLTEVFMIKSIIEDEKRRKKEVKRKAKTVFQELQESILESSKEDGTVN